MSREKKKKLSVFSIDQITVISSCQMVSRIQKFQTDGWPPIGVKNFRLLEKLLTCPPAFRRRRRYSLPPVPLAISY